jgi:hypothetical protein
MKHRTVMTVMSWAGTGEPDDQLWTELDGGRPPRLEHHDYRNWSTVPERDPVQPDLHCSGRDVNYKYGEWTVSLGYRHQKFVIA